MKFSVIDSPFLVASSIPFNAKDIYSLHQQGVRAIVSLTTSSLIGLSNITQDLFAELDIAYLHSPIRDHYPPTQEQAQEILEFIERMKSEERKAFIHCHAGVGRTGTILHAYFLKQGLSLAAAEAKVKERRIQCMLISDEQKQFLREFAKISPIELWTEWEIFKGEDGDIVYAFSQQFPPDGIFVEISIRQRSDNYEVWSISEHRISGPYENVVGTVQTLEEALELSEEELRAWENHLLGVISFYQLEDDYGCFSNFARYPIELKGKTWPTSEHYFQAQKFVGTEHEEEVRMAETPRIAAQMGRDRSRSLRSDWEMVKLDVMREAVMAKFTQHLELRHMLMRTGDSLLIEHTENDSYWGDGGDGKGKNMLGRVLMEIREKIKAGV